MLSYNVGSPAYMSPEAYNDSFYSEKSDVWALGVVLHEMLTGTIPVMRTTNVDHYFQNLKHMKTAEILHGYQNPLCIQLLLSALSVDASARPTASQLLTMMLGQSEGMSPLRKRTNSEKGEFKKIEKTYEKFQPLHAENENSYVEAYSPLRPTNRPKSQIPMGFVFSARKEENISIKA